jgi:glycosyltransferase involved in cell wall biosynthesis
MLGTLLKQRADIYQFHDPELIPVGLLLKLVFRKRVIYDLCEDFPSMMLNKRYLPSEFRGIVNAVVKFAESTAAKHLDGIVTADPLTLRRLARVRGSRKLVFLNFPILHYFPAKPAATTQFDFVYRGGLSERAGVLLLFEAMRAMVRRGRRPRVLLIGYTDDEVSLAAIEAASKDKILAGLIEIRGRIPHEEMAATLSLAKVGLCPLRPIPKFLLNIPVKVWEYWACGIPAIATNLPPIRPFFRDGQYGMLVPPDDAQALADACEWMMDHPAEAQEMGRNGLRAIQERLNNGGEVNRLIRFYEHLMREPG